MYGDKVCTCSAGHAPCDFCENATEEEYEIFQLQGEVHNLKNALHQKMLLVAPSLEEKDREIARLKTDLAIQMREKEIVTAGKNQALKEVIELLKKNDQLKQEINRVKAMIPREAPPSPPGLLEVD